MTAVVIAIHRDSNHSVIYNLKFKARDNYFNNEKCEKMYYDRLFRMQFGDSVLMVMVKITVSLQATMCYDFTNGQCYSRVKYGTFSITQVFLALVIFSSTHQNLQRRGNCGELS